MDAGIESKEVKPKFERVIQFQKGGADQAPFKETEERS